MNIDHLFFLQTSGIFAYFSEMLINTDGMFVNFRGMFLVRCFVQILLKSRL